MSAVIDPKIILKKNAGAVESRRARSTGTVVTLYKGDEAGLDTDGGEMPWSTVCEPHGGIVCHSSRATARSWMACPETWGPTWQARAERLGVAWIAEDVMEKGDAWLVTDLGTGETYKRPLKYKGGERVDFFDDERGWVEGEVYGRGDYEVTVFPKGAERWDSTKHVKVNRSRLRLTHSVRKPEGE